MTWKVHIDDRPDYFVRGLVRVLAYREVGDSIDWLRQDGDILRAPQGVAVPIDDGPDRLGFLLPPAALEVLRDAIDARLGKRVDAAVVDELRASLSHERHRNDHLIEDVAHLAALAIAGMSAEPARAPVDVHPIEPIDLEEPF